MPYAKVLHLSVRWFQYTRELKFEDAPDYNKIADIFFEGYD